MLTNENTKLRLGENVYKTLVCWEAGVTAHQPKRLNLKLKVD